METILQCAYFLILTIGYWVINRSDKKQIEFWKEAYYSERNLNDACLKYCLSDMVRKAIEREDYAEAARAKELLDSITSQPPDPH